MKKMLAKGSMSLSLALALGVGAGLATYGAPSARAADKRASPHEKVSATVSGKKVTIEYGRPFKKDRVLFGKAGIVPDGEVWRTGADEASTLTTEGELTIGTLKVPKGTYSFFTIPGEKEWTLIVNKEAKQWGSFKYDQKKDLGRTPMTVSSAKAPVEQFTITVEPQADKKSAVLKLAWDTVVASVNVSGS